MKSLLLSPRLPRASGWAARLWLPWWSPCGNPLPGPDSGHGVLLSVNLRVFSSGPQSGGLSVMAICGLDCKNPRPQPCPSPKHVGACGTARPHPSSQPARLGPQATCGPAVGSGVVLCPAGIMHLLPHLHLHSHDPKGLHVHLCVQVGQKDWGPGPPLMAPSPSGHPGGERPACRRCSRRKPVLPGGPAPELSEGKNPIPFISIKIKV